MHDLATAGRLGSHPSRPMDDVGASAFSVFYVSIFFYLFSFFLNKEKAKKEFGGCVVARADVPI